ncbi:hypothetical protein NUH88_15505 [Nisaea acidiphila]|uniref:Uncharacterized protein n=1 Tax=Nisaea acidiphila TaxID=1862145 RepID=A0A9J7ANR3_9PROT|nr:hypothetical protein [Nisaea acidiphila]UUX48806.1 hypothetical protein NUH88_15505 [Nisaea acidiphila]
MAGSTRGRIIARRVLTVAAIIIGIGIPISLILLQWSSTVRALIDPMTTCWIPVGQHFLFLSEVVSIYAFAVAPLWAVVTAVLLLPLYFIGGTSWSRSMGLTLLPLFLVGILYFGVDFAVKIESRAYASVKNTCER